jgi:hypothetical protein
MQWVNTSSEDGRGAAAGILIGSSSKIFLDSSNIRT